MTRCYLGLGSNLEQPSQQLDAALALLSEQPNIEIIGHSSYFASKAIGPGKQPDYLNATVAIETALAPETLLLAIQAIEHQQGRQRDINWGARTLDIDILLYGQQQIQTDTLSIPHPRIKERAFVLAPLAELAAKIEPELTLPDGTSPASALNCLPHNLVWPQVPVPNVINQ